MLSLIVLLIAAASLPAAVPESLTPAGTWRVMADDDQCVIARDFVSASTKLTLFLGIEPIRDRATTVILTGPGSLRLPQTGTLSVSLGKAQLAKMSFRSRTDKSKWIAQSRFRETVEIGMLETVSVWGFSFDRGPRFLLEPTEVSAAIKAARDCNRQLLTSWGVDADSASRVVQPPEAINGSAEWISMRDIPGPMPTSIKGGTTILWTVGTDGSIAMCKAVRSSGDRTLDEAACNALKKNGRYKPARDRDGNPVVVSYMRRIVWGGYGLD